MTKPSSAALWVYRNIGRGVHMEKQLAIIQSALDEARNDALEEAAEMIERGVDTEHPIIEGRIMKNFGASCFWAAHVRKLKDKGDGND